MFYDNKPDFAKLRFGDIIEGLISILPQFSSPLLTLNNQSFNINITANRLFVVMTPCCSVGRDSTIGLDAIAISPLVKINSKFSENPFFLEDFTRINRMMMAENSLSPSVWEKLGPVEQKKRQQVGRAYSLLNYFIFEPSAIFPTYDLVVNNKPVPTQYHMIDFKNIYSLTIPRNHLLSIKRMQMSIETREELRNKLSNFFGRIPDEDRCGLT